MKVVSPYRPFVPENGQHQRLGPFDWIAALRMLAASVRRSCHCDTYALTDLDTTLPVPTIHVPTVETRLMRWILEVSLRYLESPAFDDDTVFVSPDTIVIGDLRRYFVTGCDLGLVVRPAKKYEAKPILNSLQWWPLAGRERLVSFYQKAYALSATLAPGVLRWGADCEALRRLVAPVAVGCHPRAGLRVAMYDAVPLLYSVNLQTCRQLVPGRRVAWPRIAAVIDFKGARKRYMAPFFRQAEAQQWA